MEDVIDELRELAETVPVPLELPDNEDIVLVEEQILIPIPYEFRQFLLEVSDVIYGSIEPVTVMDASSHSYLPEVTALAWDRGLPRHVIPLCETADGYYCVEQDDSVRLWSQGDFQEETWQSVWQWAKEIWLDRN
jgi:hypothetical protein